METIESKNPATGEIVSRLESFDPGRIEEIVNRARVAQKWWGLLTYDERSSYLVRAKEYMLAHMDEIAQAVSLNNGKPLVQALAEVIPMIQTVSYAQKKAKKILKDKTIWLGPSLPTKIAKITYRPLGVLGIISPWNYPLSTPLAEIILGLACGNAVIIKPSEVTGLVNEQIQKIVDSMQLPEDLFTMIHGRGDVGAALASSGINRIIVTGSVETGRKVMATASKRLTPVTLELGGKDSMIVLDDADLDKATSAAVTGGLYNTGQTCCSVERLLVHKHIAPAFIEMMAAKMKKVRQGAPTGYDTDLGPVTYDRQKATYLAHVKDVEAKHGKIIFGETTFDGVSPFMKPLIVEAADGLLTWEEETFGPVIAVKTFETEEEAIQINNNSPFGLTALIWTKNNKRAAKMARRLNVGVVVVNDAPFTNAVPSLPWGGVHDSGFGWVHGEFGLKELCQAQVFTYDLTGQQKQVWWFPHSKTQYDFFKNYVTLLEGKGLKTRWRAFLAMIKSLMNMGQRL